MLLRSRVDVLLYSTDREHGHWCRPDRLFGDAAEEDPIRTAPPRRPHHDNVDVIGVDTVENYIRWISLFDMLYRISNAICLRIFDDLLGGFRCCLFVLLSRDS